MNFGRIIMHYMEYCHSRHLRHRTMTSYEQTLVLFALWMEKLHGIRQVEAEREAQRSIGNVPQCKISSKSQV